MCSEAIRKVIVTLIAQSSAGWPDLIGCSVNIAELEKVILTSSLSNMFYYKFRFKNASCEGLRLRIRPLLFTVSIK
jgi:hypothetical protein